MIARVPSIFGPTSKLVASTALVTVTSFVATAEVVVLI